MRRQAEMFERPTTRRVHRAHVVDAGHGPGPGRWAEFECARCGWRSEWRHIDSVSEGKRGVPCPDCNDRAALSGSPAPSTEGLREWQPIAGAPRDQNIIVAAMNTYSKTWIVGEARWQSDDPDHPDDGDWWWANISPGDYTGDSIMNMNGAVEFWQPLPAPPDAELNISNEPERTDVSLNQPSLPGSSS